MAKLRVNALGDDAEHFINDLFNYVVDGGLEDFIANALTNKNQIVSFSHWDDKDKELIFEVTKVHQFEPYCTLGEVADPVHLGAGIEGNNLILDVTYQGSHKDHLFELVWDGDYLEGETTQANLVFRHSAQGDEGHNTIHKKLAYTLTDLKPCNINIYVGDEHLHMLEFHGHD
mgnify:CR=1 FL=1